MKRAIIVLAGLIVVLLLGINMHFGTLSPCGIIRQQARDAAAKQGGVIAMLAAAAPDSVLDALIRTQLGAETPDRCLMALLKGEKIGQPDKHGAPPPPE